MHHLLNQQVHTREPISQALPPCDCVGIRLLLRQFDDLDRVSGHGVVQA